MKKLLQTAHPWLFTLFSLLLFYRRYGNESVPTEILRPLVVLSILNVIVYFIAYKVTQKAAWAAISTSLFVFAFHYETSVFMLIGGITLGILATTIISFLILKRELSITTIAHLLTTISFVLVIIITTTLVQSFAPLPDGFYQEIKTRKNEIALPLTIPENTPPDIYYIVLDAYTNAETLSDFYGYDNTDFVTSLEKKGFIVPDNIYANYPRTSLSIGSTTNLDYWDTIVTGMDDVTAWWPTKYFLDDNRVKLSLEAAGYRTIYFANDWGLTNNKKATIYFQPYPVQLTNYEDYLVRTTPLGILQKPFQRIMPTKTNESHRQFITYTFETLKEIPTMDGPKFVFAHIVFPHDPIVFDKNGAPIQARNTFSFGQPKVTKSERLQLYLGQIEYANSQIKEVVDAILEKSSSPPIIIIQADHGLGLSMKFSPNTSQCFQERLSIFGAYYLPEKDIDDLFQDYSSVNLFRIIFNEYFETELPLLENRYFFTEGRYLFAGMGEITEQMNIPCEMDN